MNTKKLGFSLIELVVAITIGGVILASVMGSFLTLSKMRQQLDLTRQIQREINFAVIRMADRVRSQSIDYGAEINSDDSSFLPINGNEKFEFRDDNLFMNDTPLFSSGLMVQDLKFTISLDPEENPDPVQPSVTIEL